MGLGISLEGPYLPAPAIPLMQPKVALSLPFLSHAAAGSLIAPLVAWGRYVLSKIGKKAGVVGGSQEGGLGSLACRLRRPPLLHEEDGGNLRAIALV